MSCASACRGATRSKPPHGTRQMRQRGAATRMRGPATGRRALAGGAPGIAAGLLAPPPRPCPPPCGLALAARSRAHSGSSGETRHTAAPSGPARPPPSARSSASSSRSRDRFSSAQCCSSRRRTADVMFLQPASERHTPQSHAGQPQSTRGSQRGNGAHPPQLPCSLSGLGGCTSLSVSAQPPSGPCRPRPTWPSSTARP
jgi:hypothetical protein